MFWGGMSWLGMWLAAIGSEIPLTKGNDGLHSLPFVLIHLCLLLMGRGQLCVCVKDKEKQSLWDLLTTPPSV